MGSLCIEKSWAVLGKGTDDWDMSRTDILVWIGYLIHVLPIKDNNMSIDQLQHSFYILHNVAQVRGWMKV